MTTDEKLAIAIDILRIISGDPQFDDVAEFSTGVNPKDWASVQHARYALARIGASTEFPSPSHFNN